MRKTTTLRQRLMASFIAVAIVPVAVATGLAVPWFRSAINDEARRTLSTHATVADELFTEKVGNQADQAAAIALVLRDGAAREGGRLGAELRRQALALGLTYALYVDNNGVVRGVSSGETGGSLAWPAVEKLGQQLTSAVLIVPEDQLARFNEGGSLDLKVKETDGGSAAQQEAEGALAIVGVAPVRSLGGQRTGTIVSVSTLKKDNSFVDSISAKVGGVATVFQNGVRVQTTVKDDQGARAIGTAISDKIRAAVLETGKPYAGEAFVVNRPYLASYNPIRDPEGAVIGMVFVGIDRAPYNATVRNFALGMGLVLVLGVGFAVLFAWAAAKSLSGPIVAVTDAAERVSTGDLTVAVPTKGYREAVVLGGAFNKMTEGLRRLIDNVGNSVNGLNTVATEIADASAFEADSSTSQASAVAEATATIEELDRSFQLVSDGARRVLEIAEDSLAVAENGREVVQDGASNVQRLANGASATLQAASHLADVAHDIDQVTFVIGAIAEQTKILALNAAIEAARAGEAGRGFGVVAAEIRSLADSVSTSVGRIASLVGNIQEASQVLAVTAQGQAEMSESTVADSTRTRDNFDEIYERMDNTAAAAREITTAAAEQQSAARQIVQVMQQVSEGVASSASASQQLAESARHIKRETQSLSGGLTGFRTE